MENETTAIIVIAENTLLTPELTGKSKNQILNIYSQAVQTINIPENQLPPISDHQSWRKLEDLMKLAIQIEAWQSLCETSNEFVSVAMPNYGIGHKEYLQFVLQKIIYFHQNYPENSNIIRELALEVLASAYSINICQQGKAASPVLN